MASDMPGWGQIVPFARSTKELRRRALTQRKGKQWLEAAELLRRAVEQEPDNERVLLDLAETYSQMGCCVLSNRLLLRVMRMNPQNNTCFYFMGCNFYAMQAWTQARDCLSAYIQRAPNEAHHQEANDMLFFLYLRQESREELRISRATQALESGKHRLAARLMHRVIPIAPLNSDVYAISAFMQLMDDKPEMALHLARRAWRLDRRNTRALCAMAMALYRLGSGKTGERYIARAARVAQTEAELNMVAHTACEAGAHTLARGVLTTLLRSLPLEPTLLHMLAACHCKLGEYREALPLWARMRRIDPEDTVATYCFESLREAMAKGQDFDPSYLRQVPVEETLVRLTTLRELAETDANSLLDAWRTQVPIRRLVAWGLQQPEPRIRRVMLGMLRIAGDESARWMLRELLIATDIDDAMKQEALETLYELNDPGPHPVVTAGGFSAAYVQATDEQDLPGTYERGLKRLAARLNPEFGECYHTLETVWRRLLHTQDMLSNTAVWLEALEWLFRARHGQEGLKPDRRTMRYVRKLQKIWAEDGVEENGGEEDGMH